MKKIVIILSVLTALSALAEVATMDFAIAGAVRDGFWKQSVQSVCNASGGSSFELFGEAGHALGVYCSMIELDQTEPLAIGVKGSITRTDPKTVPGQLIGIMLEIYYQDGSREKPVPVKCTASDAGKTLKIEKMYTPKKPIKRFRVICYNINASAPTRIDNLSICVAKAQYTRSAAKIKQFKTNSLTLDFECAAGMAALAGFTNEKTRWNFIQPGGDRRNIWRIVLRNKKTGRLLNIDKCGDVPAFTQDHRGLQITWKGNAASNAKLTVVASVSPVKGEPMVEWGINAFLDSGEYALEEIIYPVFRSVNVPGDGNQCALFSPHDIGRLYTNPIKNMTENLSLRYGTCYMAMQYTHFAGTDDSFYYAAYDGDGYIKWLGVSRNVGDKFLAFQMTHVMERNACRYASPWKVRTGSCPGNWYDAAMYYRRWALKQSWCLKGPMASRPDFPKPLQEISIWLDWVDNYAPQTPEQKKYLASMTKAKMADTPIPELQKKTGIAYDTAKIIKNFTALRQFYGVPLADYSHPYLHFFNVATPAYVVPDGLSEGIKALKEQGIYFVPWTSARLFDIKSEKYHRDHAVEAAVVNSSGKVAYMLDSVMMAPMCMSTDYWRRTIHECTARLLGNGFTGIYYDELATTGAEVCYSGEHGHIPGGGNYGLHARRKLMEDLHHEMRKTHADYFTNGEGAMEFLIGSNDSNFMFASLFPNSVPALQAVYHDYTYCFCRAPGKWMDHHCRAYLNAYVNQNGRSSKDEVITHAFRNWAYGMNIGIFRRDLTEFSPEVAAVIRDLAQAYYANRQYLIFGKMLRQPVIKNTVMRDVSWSAGNFSRGQQPLVQASVWEAPDGTLGVMLANTCEFQQVPDIILMPYLKKNTHYELRDNLTGTSLGVIDATMPSVRIPVDGWKARGISLIETRKPIQKIALPPYVFSFVYDLVEKPASSVMPAHLTVENFSNALLKGTATLVINNADVLQIPFAVAANTTHSQMGTFSLPEKRGSYSCCASIKLEKGQDTQELTHAFDIGVTASAVTDAATKTYTMGHLAQSPVGKKLSAIAMPVSSAEISDVTCKVAGLNGSADLSVKARFAWHEDGVLLRFAVKDDCHVMPSMSPSEIWRGDCIQIGYAVYMQEQGQNLWRSMVLTEIENKPYVHIFETPDASEFIKLEVTHQGDVTTYTAFMPKSLFPADFKEGFAIPFSFTVNESDANGFRGWLEWTPGICGSKNTALYGKIIFGN